MKKIMAIIISAAFILGSSHALAATVWTKDRPDDIKISDAPVSKGLPVEKKAPVKKTTPVSVSAKKADPIPERKEAPAPGKTVFNRVSDYFSTFDRPFKRPGNKQGFWEATADWMRNIDKY